MLISFSGLTAREQKALENSWAKIFADEIIKELFDYSDDEMVENLMLDFRTQYALHTTGFEEQPLSDKKFESFSEFLHGLERNGDLVKLQYWYGNSCLS